MTFIANTRKTEATLSVCISQAGSAELAAELRAAGLMTN